VIACDWADPFESDTGEPKSLPSIVNWTLPVGVAPPPLAVTRAVNVTLWPNVDGLAEDETVVVVAAGPLPTFCVSVPALAVKLAEFGAYVTRTV
jgi:hypothetical protein